MGISLLATRGARLATEGCSAERMLQWAGKGGEWVKRADLGVQMRGSESGQTKGFAEMDGQRKLGPSGLDAYGLRPQSPRMTMSVWSDGRCLLSAVRYSFLFMQPCCLVRKPVTCDTQHVQYTEVSTRSTRTRLFFGLGHLLGRHRQG